LELKVRQLKKQLFLQLYSVSILIGLITLSKALGVALPWIRLSVLGAVTYELPAAETAARAFGLSISDTINDPKVFSAIIWVMSIGCIIPLIIIPLFLKKFQKGFDSIKKNDKKWGDILMSALFLGMISAFLGMGVSNGIISVLTLISSATIMIVCGLLVKKGGLNWLKNYALPFSMIGAMAIAIILNKVI